MSWRSQWMPICFRFAKKELTFSVIFNKRYHLLRHEHCGRSWIFRFLVLLKVSLNARPPTAAIRRILRKWGWQVESPSASRASPKSARTRARTRPPTCRSFSISTRHLSSTWIFSWVSSREIKIRFQEIFLDLKLFQLVPVLKKMSLLLLKPRRRKKSRDSFIQRVWTCFFQCIPVYFKGEFPNSNTTDPEAQSCDDLPIFFCGHKNVQEDPDPDRSLKINWPSWSVTNIYGSSALFITGFGLISHYFSKYTYSVFSGKFYLVCMIVFKVGD